MSAVDSKIIATQLRMAMVCIIVAVIGGAVSALHYLPAVSEQLNSWGFGLNQLRPVHTTFASLWIFGAAIAVVYHYLAHSGDGLTQGDRARFKFHTVCWLVAGAGIIATLLLGISSGREYLGFHPVFSLILVAGWFAFGFNFLRRLKNGFWGQPIYIYFWTVGILFFVWTFAEGHAYLLPGIAENPVRDLQIQWKSCGTLVGSFNFMMYGALIYVVERMSGDKTYGQSSTAFWLFFVGCLNSFTNYVHHTYHLPQSETAKWVAFVVSMAEVIILAKIMFDLLKSLKGLNKGAFCGTSSFLYSAKWWTGVMLVNSLILSVPTLNSLVHGTHAIAGHAMGTTIGIDTMVLLGTSSFLVSQLRGAPVEPHLHCPSVRKQVWALNACVALLVGWLTLAGSTHGVYRYYGESTPAWVTDTRYMLPLFGSLLGILLLAAALRCLRLLGGRSQVAPVGEHRVSVEG